MLARKLHACIVPEIAAIERLPKWLLCVPLVAHWLWLGLRYRSVTLPTVANPPIEMGGIAGESKLACLDLIGAAFDRWVARPVIVSREDSVRTIHRLTGFGFPVIAKPDIGWCGFGVRRIETAAELEAYARAFPRQGRFMLQRFVDLPLEAGLFYLHWPDERAGRIIGVTLRYPPQILGDGIRTVKTLIGASARTRRLSAYYAKTLGSAAMARVPKPSEGIVLTTVASTRVGSRYESASHLASPALHGTLDRIAQSMDGFHFGRFDVKFASPEMLRQGEFIIIEVNGAGSEAIHFWDPALSLGAAFAGVFAKQRTLFALADMLRRRGHKPAAIRTLATAYLRQQRLIRRYPAST